MDRLKSLLAIGACGAVAAIGAGPALAGEVTGSGKKENQNQGKSWCSFSGLNDDPGAPLDGSGPNGPGGAVSVVRAGEQARHRGPARGQPRHVLQPEPDSAAPAAEPDQVTRSGRPRRRGRPSG